VQVAAADLLGRFARSARGLLQSGDGKTQSGLDPLTNAPTELDQRQLNELGLRLLPKA